MKVNELETPALVVEKEIMERNMDKMMKLLEGTGIALRPHYKTNKCTEIARMQIAKGAKGITCSKLGEAEDLAAAGIQDILIANQVVQKSKIARMAFLAKSCRLTVCVDSEENIRQLSEAAVLADSTIHCYVELDIGMNRCGVHTFEDFYKLAALLEELPGVSYDGIQAYAGHLAHEYNKKLREAAIRANEERLKELIAYLRERGIETREVSGTSTGSVYMKANSSVYTEVQAGSYIFMDMAYEGMDTIFDHALYVAATVVSASPDHFVIDAGIKSLAPDQGNPQIAGLPCENVNMSEEHTAFYMEHSFKAGDMVKVYPGHCCTTVNLYDKIHMADGDEIINKVPVVSRGKAF